MSMKKGRIIIVNPKKFAWQTREIKIEGKKNLQLVCDFDRTLTKCFVDGQKAPSLVGILREGDYLSAKYALKAYRLFNYYHPIEINSKLDLNFKKKMMLEWWQKHFRLLIKEGLAKEDIYQAMTKSSLQLRPGAKEFFETLDYNKIPLVIFSASGLGELSIEYFLRKRALLLSNVYIVANAFSFNSDNRLIGIKEPIIHVFNKDETIIKQYDFYPVIKERQNVIVIGDSLGDATMHKGLKHKQVLKIAFLNENEKENLPAYRRAFDVLILGDASFYHINQILKKLF